MTLKYDDQGHPYEDLTEENKKLESRIKELDNSLAIALDINDKYQREGVALMKNRPLDTMDEVAYRELQAENEINQCKVELEKLYNQSIEDFCYPYGRFNESIVDLVKNAGFVTATTMVRGRANERSNILKLPRIPVTHHTLPHLFLAKILTKYEDNR